MSLQHRALLVARKVSRRIGIDVVRHNFYSPIPTDLSESTWGRRSPLRGIDFDLDQQMDWVREHVTPFSGEFRPPVRLPGYVFEYANKSFGHGDADVLYGVIRSRKPSRIVELGSGNSSVVIRLALQQNESSGHQQCDYQVFDPFPNDLLATTRMAVAIRPVAAERLEESIVSSLGAGDVLFVDTTHTVRIGGDVVRIVLDLLPLLSPGVLVQIHDVPMPFEYDRELPENGFYWAEMYLVQAFLAYNEKFAVRASLRALSVDRREGFAQVVPSITSGAPISLWIERVA